MEKSSWKVSKRKMAHLFLKNLESFLIFEIILGVLEEKRRPLNLIYFKDVGY
jgi:hypothetical protein